MASPIFTELPTLAVLGGGNSLEDGPAYSNVQNAETAATLINNGLASPEHVFTLGRGPKALDYPITEAEFIADAVGSRLDTASPDFHQDRLSTNSATNILRLSEMLDEFDIRKVGIVCLPWQSTRVVDMAKMALKNDVEVVSFTSDSARTPAGIVKEIALLGIFKATKFGINSGDRSDYQQAIDRYNRIVGGGKSAAVRVVNSGLADRIPGVSRTTRY